MSYPDQIQSSPKTYKDSIIKLLQTIGLRYIVAEEKDVSGSVEEDLVALYRLVCGLEAADEMRGYFDHYLDDETLDFIERQHAS